MQNFYTLVTHLLTHKAGKFYCIIYINDKITLLLVIWQSASFDVTKNCLN